ncbi:OmpA family protein [Pontibacter sp. G13]|uniref:OmpA family protein n=1 Tax=Pontibacter sp. G13 TaxID=3074898 RepID=UPI002889A1B9|nr:OmpA family protein [Pontibacter sp. G13]WNJ19416.1 OmpA family protein [Pontibacter sp. G13]
MAINLLDIASGLFNRDSVRMISNFLGESETNTQSALSGILPAVLGGITSQASNKTGLNNLFNILSKPENNGDMLDSLSGVFSNGKNLQQMIAGGGPAVKSIFGDNLGNVVNFLSNDSGVSKSGITSLASIATPLMTNILGREQKKHGFDVAALGSLLSGQGKFLKSALPAGLAGAMGISNMDNMFGGLQDSISGFAQSASDTTREAANTVADAGRRAADTGRRAVDSTKEAIENTSKNSGSWTRRVLPALALLLVGTVLYTMFKGDADNAAQRTESAIKGTAQDIGNAASKAASATGEAIGNAADATGEAIANTAEAAKDAITSIKLPDGSDFSFKPGSFEGNMYNFLSGEDKEINQVFTFDNIEFETGSASLTGNSASQIEHLAKLMDNYPDVNIRVEGHTDNTGGTDSNLQLSESRAESVKNQLVQDGVSADRISTKGYGESQPIATNDTPEGRDQNRRINIRVTQY